MACECFMGVYYICKKNIVETQSQAKKKSSITRKIFIHIFNLNVLHAGKFIHMMMMMIQPDIDHHHRYFFSHSNRIESNRIHMDRYVTLIIIIISNYDRIL